jgi:hypothetical protein
MDLKDPRLIYLKGFLFGVILLTAAGVIIVQTRDWLIAGMVVLVVWSSARGYYFMFYVIEKYVDPGYRFAGVFDFVRYAAGRKKASRQPPQGIKASSGHDGGAT